MRIRPGSSFYDEPMNWKVDEPVGYDGIEESNRFDQLIYRALAEDQISISKAASLKNQKLAEFRNETLLVQRTAKALLVTKTL